MSGSKFGGKRGLNLRVLVRRPSATLEHTDGVYVLNRKISAAAPLKVELRILEFFFVQQFWQPGK